MLHNLMARISSWFTPRQTPIASTPYVSRGRSYYYEGIQLILPVLFYRRTHAPDRLPHMLQLEPGMEPRPMLFLGANTYLEFPDRSRHCAFIIGVVYATPYWCKIAWAVLVGNALEIMYLSVRREWLGLGTPGFPSLISWKNYRPQWTFLPTAKILQYAHLVCVSTPNPRIACEIFLQRWHPLIREHQELILGPTHLILAEEPRRGQQVGSSSSLE